MSGRYRSRTIGEHIAGIERHIAFLESVIARVPSRQYELDGERIELARINRIRKESGKRMSACLPLDWLG